MSASTSAAAGAASPGTLQCRQVVSRSVKALIEPPTRSMSRAIRAADRVGVPLKTMCFQEMTAAVLVGTFVPGTRGPYQKPRAAVPVCSTGSTSSVAPRLSSNS